jgi:hypothetical protein
MGTAVKPYSVPTEEIKASPVWQDLDAGRGSEGVHIPTTCRLSDGCHLIFEYFTARRKLQVIHPAENRPVIHKARDW